MMPTFLGIGAQRCGTTWAHRCLAQHPDVFVSTPKELRYFTANYEKGRDWYERQFSDAQSAKARGEITPGYLYRPTALERIAKDLPEARLFAILRNPIERAFSAYRFFQARDYRGLAFEQALRQDKELLDQGRYVASLDRLWRLFPREQCLVMLYDDLRDSPGDTARRLYAFLGVDSGFRPSGVAERVNTPILPRSQALLRKCGLGSIADLVKASPLAPAIRAWHARRTGARDGMNESDRKFLREFYADEIRQLGAMLERDLGEWLE